VEWPAQGRSLRLPLRGLYGKGNKPKRGKKITIRDRCHGKTHFLRVSFDIFQDYLI
jgi:hypothetical protein